MPVLTALSAYETAEACNAAQVAVTTALGDGDQVQHVACISAESLRAFGKANQLDDH
ncbi:MAG: hypothetical protein ABIO40_09260 [Devosia sp.]